MDRPLLVETGWTAVWIFNPDTFPEPDALAALVDYAKRRNKGMIGSRLMMPGRSDVAWSRGLRVEQVERQADRARHPSADLSCA